MGIDVIFLIALLVMSVVIHEVSHGFAAHWLGDPTAKLEGRLTLNPIVHIDPLGSVILPAILLLSGSSFLFGWAKPVPYNPYNLRKGGRFAEAIVAFAGPLSNIVIALFCGSLLRFGILPATSAPLVYSIVFLNVLLAVFNLIPIPPLDGSKVFTSILPKSLAFQYEKLRSILEQNIILGFSTVILFVLVFGGYFVQLVSFITDSIITV